MINSDISGGYIYPKVIGLQGYVLPSVGASSGYLQWNGSAWVFGSGGSSYTATPPIVISGTVISFSGALPNGTTATTQAQYNNSTDVATTQYVDSKSLPYIYSLLILSNF